jgi:hypothetical protein
MGGTSSYGEAGKCSVTPQCTHKDEDYDGDVSLYIHYFMNAS